MNSLYLIGEGRKGDERGSFYTIHYSIKLIPNAERERATKCLAAKKSSSIQDRNTPVGVTYAAGGTSRVVLPPSLLKLVTLSPLPPHVQCFGLRFLGAGSFRTPHFLLSSVQTPQIKKSETRFCLFNKLPLELRVMVWRETINMAGPRVVQVWHDRTAKKIRSDMPIPIQLQICKESRSVGLQYYQHVFNIGPSTCGVYANLKEDWIYLCGGPDMPLHPRVWFERFLDAVLKGEREEIQNLAIDFSAHPQLGWRALRRVPSLKQVALVKLAPERYGHIPERSTPPCRRRLEDAWRRNDEYVLQEITNMYRDWNAHFKRTRGTWRPPVAMQWCLHALKTVRISRKLGKGVQPTGLVQVDSA